MRMGMYKKHQSLGFIHIINFSLKRVTNVWVLAYKESLLHLRDPSNTISLLKYISHFKIIFAVCLALPGTTKGALRSNCLAC